MSAAHSPIVEAAAFELSYPQLDENAARTFRLLPADSGPDMSTGAVAELANTHRSDAGGTGPTDAGAWSSRAGCGAGGGCTTCCACTPARSQPGEGG
jgi:hypothetical protein